MPRAEDPGGKSVYLTYKDQEEKEEKRKDGEGEGEGEGEEGKEKA